MASIIGGNMLSPFYSSALLVPYSGATAFVPFASQSSGWNLGFVRATPRRKRGLPDVTHSLFPQCRGRRQTQVSFDAILDVFLNPDTPPESETTLVGNAAGYQLYLTLGTLANYPAIDTNLLYFWIPSVFVREIPHLIDVGTDPAPPISFTLAVDSNSPAFFVPTDGGHASGAIGTFESYAASFANPWAW
jgi:hypothetical protein